ncbi:PPA1309 family protein [Gordonia sp. NPDC003376]
MSDLTAPRSPFSPDDLGRALADALRFVSSTDGIPSADAGRAPQVFALVPTALLAQLQPDLVSADDDSALSPIAEEPLPATAVAEPHAVLEEFLATASWPDAVAGAAVVVDILMLPPDARPDLPTADGSSPIALRSAATTHPDSRPARLAVGALRHGRSLALVELWSDEGIPERRTHPDLARDLQDALAASLDG